MKKKKVKALLEKAKQDLEKLPQTKSNESTHAFLNGKIRAFEEVLGEKA